MADRNERHPRDAFSLVLGLLIAFGAAMFLITDGTGHAFDLRWVGPTALILIGGAGLTASLRR
jgi:hypothetical protein